MYINGIIIIKVSSPEFYKKLILGFEEYFFYSISISNFPIF